MKRNLLLTIGAGLLLVACQPHSEQQSSADNQSSGTTTPVSVPVFNADSAYAFVAKQVAFGPRIPNTPAQMQCANWMKAVLKAFADTVYEQETILTGAAAKRYKCINLIGSFNPQASQRILLLAHWDTRAVSDKDPLVKNKPFEGADDGASGTGVLLEIARQLKTKKPSLGIDILLTDVEDAGVEGNDNSWCLGTQYWARHPHVPGYKANYGILLDMIGSKNAKFYMEAYSKQYAAAPTKNLWDIANQAGFSDYFRYEEAVGAITDDHYYVNTIANIPTMDIIGMQPNGDFMPHHHTQQDNLSVIDKNTLKAVGQTILQVIYAHPAY